MKALSNWNGSRSFSFDPFGHVNVCKCSCSSASTRMNRNRRSRRNRSHQRFFFLFFVFLVWFIIEFFFPKRACETLNGSRNKRSRFLQSMCYDNFLFSSASPSSFESTKKNSKQSQKVLYKSLQRQRSPVFLLFRRYTTIKLNIDSDRVFPCYWSSCSISVR